MFYSHEILTSRKHGVATVWLVATLGARSSLRKVTRKAILDVDVPKACNTIIDPSAPMALRLQGNLLFGVSRVYAQQCGYVLTDLESFRDKIRGMATVMKEMEIDPEAGRARPDQLNLSDDPAFLPDLDMNFDLSLFDISTQSARGSSILSPAVPASSQSSRQPEDEMEDEPAVMFPSAASSSGGFGGLDIGGNFSSALKSGSVLRQHPIFEESALNADPGFDFDADGNMIELATGTGGERESSAMSTPGPRGGLATGFETSARVRAEYEGGIAGPEGEDDFIFDDGIPVLEDDEPMLPSAAPFSSFRRAVESTAQQTHRLESEHIQEEQETSSAAEAPQQRAKAIKPLVLDLRTELTNKELSDWNYNYLDNMAEATHHKEQHKALALAKKKAAFWVLEQGIGGVSTAFGQDRVPHPLSIFSGQALLDALTGRESSPAGSKRARSSGSEEERGEDERRVRARGDDDEHIGRGNNEGTVLFEDDDGILMGGDDMPPSEVGRNAPPSLPDHSSQMPWNTSASRRGSAHPMGSALPGGISSSIGGPTGGFEFGPPSSLVGRGSRITSASPLQGKVSHLPRLSKIPSLEISSHIDLPSDLEDFDNEGTHSGGEAIEEEEFQLYGPAAAVDTQTAAQSQWVAATLENEAHNFLIFVDQQIKVRHGNTADEVEGEDSGKITFTQLLPPRDNTYVVAAQALLHVLSLATKGLLDVHQEEPFGHIDLTVATVVPKDDPEEEEDEHEDVQDGP